MTPISTKQLDLYKKKEPASNNGGPALPLTEHLEELRNKLIFSLITLSAALLISFSFSGQVVNLLTHMAPPETAFLQIKPGEFFFTCMRVSFFAGLLISSPVIIFQLGSFIFPGLTEKEKKIAIPILTGAPVLFLAGSLFAYFFVAPSMLNFLFGFGKDIIQTSISIEHFVSFTLLIMAICGSAFLLPIVIFALANVGILNSEILINKWRYAILTSVISGAVLTPTPDPFNMSIVSGILIALYFLSWGILRITSK